MLKTLIISLFVVVAVGMYGTGTVSAQAAVCPEGNDWIKVDNLSGLSYTFTNIPDGYKVTDNCYKAATSVVYGSGATVTSAVFNSPQGITCTAPGLPHPGCNLQDLSHASFRLEKITNPDDPQDDPDVPVVTTSETDPKDPVEEIEVLPATSGVSIAPAVVTTSVIGGLGLIASVAVHGVRTRFFS